MIIIAFWLIWILYEWLKYKISFSRYRKGKKKKTKSTFCSKLGHCVTQLPPFKFGNQVASLLCARIFPTLGFMAT